MLTKNDIEVARTFYGHKIFFKKSLTNYISGNSRLMGYSKSETSLQCVSNVDTLGIWVGGS